MTSQIVVPGYNPGNRVPGFYFALDNSLANTASPLRRILIMGQMAPDAKAEPNVAVFSTGLGDAINSYGDNSQIVTILRAYRQIDSAGEVWLLPVADDPAGQKASGSLKFSGPASGAGTLPVYIDDILVKVPVSPGDSAAKIAASFVQAASLKTTLPVTTTLLDGDVTVTLTAVNAGLVGNQIALNIALLGNAGGEYIPAGVSVAITPMSGGTQNPTLDQVLAAQGNRVYDLILHPWVDEASLIAFQSWLDGTSGRWSPMVQLYGQAITATRGSYGQLTALLLKNDPHQTVIGTSDSPSSPLSWAGWVGARLAMSMRTNPALPVTNLSIPAKPPTDKGIFDLNQRNSLLYDGISTFTVSDDGTVYIERLITTYRETPSGQPDDSCLDIERLLTAQICLQDLSLFLAAQIGGSILLQNGAKIPAGIRATTPELIKRTICSRYRWQCEQLWAQNPDYFAGNIMVDYAGEGNIRTLMPYQFADQLWSLAGNCQFLAAS